MTPRLRRRAPVATLGAEGLLWGLLAFCPLALGSAPTWTLAPIVLASVLTGLLSFAGARERGDSVALPLFSAVIALGAALCLAQLVPLPPALLGLLSPAARDVQEFALTPLGLTRWRPVSLEPAQTWREISKHLAYLSVFLSSVQVSRSRRARRRLMVVVAAVGATVAVIGLAHLLFGAKTLFGLYRFSGGSPVITPFGNRNHLAGYLILAGTVSLGLALSEKDRQRSLIWGVAYVAMGAVTLLSLSRGGIAFFLFAQGLFAFLLMRRSASREVSPTGAKRQPAWARLSGAAFAALLSVLAVGCYVAYDQLVARAETVETVEKLGQSKIELYPNMAEAASHFWLAGMGRGAFEVGYPRFQKAYPGTTFTHAENLVLHLAAEVGFLPAAALIGLALWALSRRLRHQAMGVKDLAILSAVFALGLHNLFDFNLELPACAVTACVLMGIVSRPDEERGPWVAWRGLRVVAPALGVLAVVALFPGRNTALDAERELGEQLTEGSLDETRQLANGLIDAHPADYMLYDLMGVACAGSAKGDPREALAYVNRALFLRPIDPAAHQIAARSLARLGRKSQALIEYRLAAESGVRSALDEALYLAKTVEQVRSLIPVEPKPVEEMVNRLKGVGRPEDAEALLAWALEKMKDRSDADGLWIVEANRLRGKGDFPGALAALSEAEKRNPSGIALGTTRAAVLSQMGKREEAVALLRSMIVQHPDEVSIAFALAGQLTAYGRYAQAREALARIGPFLKNMDQRGQLFAMEGKTFAGEGRHAKALQDYQSAARVQPAAASHQYLIAQAYEQLGRFPESIQAVRAGMRMGGTSPALSAWIARLEEKQRQRMQVNDQRMMEEKPVSPLESGE